MSTGGNSRDGRVSLSDAVGSFKSRKRKSIVVTASLLIVSLLVLTIGVAATTRTHNVTVGGYYPGAILGFGSFLGIIGAHLIENKRQMLVASIVFISFGVVAALCCAIVDGVFAARHITGFSGLTQSETSFKGIVITVLLVIVGLILTCMKHGVCNILQDLGPLYAGRCEYYSSVTSYDRDVHCQTASRVSCNLRVKSNTCYCCELYTCGSRVELTGGYHEYTEVRSCQDVVQLYHLLWFATVLNIVALLLGIVTAAVLGGFKDMTPTGTPDSCEPGPIAAPASAPALAPAAAPTAPLSEVPHLPPAPHSSYYNNAPCLPPYTAYDVQGSTMFPDSSGLSDDSQSGASYLWPTQIPPRYSPPYYPPDEKPPPYSP